MTTADMLRAEGRAATLVQLLSLEFGSVPSSVVEQINAASADQLESWTARVLTASSLDDVLR